MLSDIRFLALASLALMACTGGDDPGPQRARHVALDQSSTCSTLNRDACTAEVGCSWVELDLACPDGAVCPDGACVALDPCAAHDDVASCAADTGNQCDWAAVENLCPPGEACANDGYCYQRDDGDGCACLCPMDCTVGSDGSTDCPPCECDCPDGCDVPPPTCTCPEYPPGEACPMCDCAIDGGSAPGGSGAGSPGDPGGGAEAPSFGCDGLGTDECNAQVACQWVDPLPCAEGEPCALGYCVAVADVDPCSAYVDDATCGGDPTNACQWIEVCEGVACPEGGDCPDEPPVCKGSCHGSLPPDGGCVCTCPMIPCSIDEAGNVDCPVCDCSCDGGGGGACGGVVDGGPSPGGGAGPDEPNGG